MNNTVGRIKARLYKIPWQSDSHQEPTPSVTPAISPSADAGVMGSSANSDLIMISGAHQESNWEFVGIEDWEFVGIENLNFVELGIGRKKSRKP